jgi:hypothetical protein
VKLEDDRIAGDESPEGLLKSDRTDPSRPREPAPPNPPNAPDGDDEAAGAAENAPPPVFGNSPASAVDAAEKADPGATVGSKRRPGSASRPLAGVPSNSEADGAAGLMPEREDDDEAAVPEKPSNRCSGRDVDEANPKVPAVSLAAGALNQFR